MKPYFSASVITFGICWNAQNTIMHGASFSPVPGSFFSRRLQKWKYSAMLKVKSVLNAAFLALLLSPFLLSPSTYQSGRLA